MSLLVVNGRLGVARTTITPGLTLANHFRVPIRSIGGDCKLFWLGSYSGLGRILAWVVFWLRVVIGWGGLNGFVLIFGTRLKVSLSLKLPSCDRKSTITQSKSRLFAVRRHTRRPTTRFDSFNLENDNSTLPCIKAGFNRIVS